jgi:anti-anti-sigma factor
MDTGTIFHARYARTCVLKLTGELRYTLGDTFNAFLDQLFERPDFDHMLIDLTEAQSIDSTLLGLLAKIANFMRDRFDCKAVLVSDNQDINQLLDNLGFYDIFTVCERRATDSCSLQPLSGSASSTQDMAATLLEAHTILSEVNDSNKALFKEVIDALRGESQ